MKDFTKGVLFTVGAAMLGKVLYELGKSKAEKEETMVNEKENDDAVNDESDTTE